MLKKGEIKREFFGRIKKDYNSGGLKFRKGQVKIMQEATFPCASYFWGDYQIPKELVKVEEV